MGLEKCTVTCIVLVFNTIYFYQNSACLVASKLEYKKDLYEKPALPCPLFLSNPGPRGRGANMVLTLSALHP